MDQLEAVLDRINAAVADVPLPLEKEMDRLTAIIDHPRLEDAYYFWTSLEVGGEQRRSMCTGGVRLRRLASHRSAPAAGAPDAARALLWVPAGGKQHAGAGGAGYPARSSLGRRCRPPLAVWHMACCWTSWAQRVSRRAGL